MRSGGPTVTVRSQRCTFYRSLIAIINMLIASKFNI